MEPIETDGAPAAIGPYSQGVRAGRFVFASGQLPLTAEGELITDDVRKAARQALLNLSAVLAARATVAVGSLPMGARLEIEAIALVEG